MMIWWYDDTGIWSRDLIHVYIQRRDNWLFPPYLLDFNRLEKWIRRKTNLLNGQIWLSRSAFWLIYRKELTRKCDSQATADISDNSELALCHVLVWHKCNSKLNVFKGKRQNINLSWFNLSNKGNQQ